jgi:hypothetical protein
VLTLNQLIKRIQTFATAHKQLKGSFLFELPNIKGPDEARTYPCLTALLVSTEPSEQQETFSILFTVWDLPSDDNHRMQAQEVLSDTKLIANDIVAYLKYGMEDVSLDVPVTMTPVYDAGEDGSYGWEFTLNLRLNQGLDLCFVPYDLITANIYTYDIDGGAATTIYLNTVTGGTATTLYDNTINGGNATTLQ